MCKNVRVSRIYICVGILVKNPIFILWCAHKTDLWHDAYAKSLERKQRIKY